MQRFIEFGSARGRIGLDTLVRELPAGWKEGDVAAAIAERLCRRSPARGENAVLMNLLVARSRRVQELVVLARALATIPEGIMGVDLGLPRATLEELLGVALPATLRVESGAPPAEDLDRRQVVLLFAKALLHGLYRRVEAVRQWSRPQGGGSEWVKASVPVTLRLWEDEDSRMGILAMPVAHSVGLHLGFMKRHWGRVRMAGYPFSLWRLLRLLWLGSRRRALACAEVEHQAGVRLARELWRAGVRRLFSGDEYEVPAVALHREFRRLGGESSNRAHGIGLYGPVTSYDVFEVVTEGQERRYRRYAEGVIRRWRPDRRVRGLPTGAPGVSEAITFVLVDQFEVVRASKPERRLQARLLGALRASGVPARVKAHPRVPAGRLRDLTARDGIEWVASLGELPVGRLVFFGVNSTLLLDLLGEVPVFAVEGEGVLPQQHFGPSFPTIALDDVPLTIERMGPPEEWSGELSRQRGVTGYAVGLLEGEC